MRTQKSGEVGKIILISVTLTTFPYLHPIAHLVRIIFFLFLFRYANGKPLMKNIELASAVSVSSTCYKPKKVDKHKHFASRWILSAYGGVPFVLLLELSMFVYYIGLGIMVRSTTLTQLCNDISLCNFIELPEFDDTDIDTKTWLYKLTFQQYNPFLLISLIVITVSLYLVFIISFYRFGHQKKVVINKN